MAAGAPINVLHVDDEPSIGDLVETFLEREDDDLSVTSVETADEALGLLTETRVDCVVSDYDMPNVTGLEFLNAVRARRPDVPFILFTGQGSEDVARDAFQVGVTDYMHKQAGTDQYAVLANRIQNAVSQYRAETASARYDTVFESMDNAVFVLDPNDRLVSVNDVYVDAVDVSRERLLGTHLRNLEPFDTTTIAEHVSRLRATGTPDSVEFDAAFAPEGREVRRGRVHLTCLPRDGENTQGVIGTWSESGDGETAAEATQYASRLKDIVLDTSTSLMSAEADEVDTKVEWTLRSVGEYMEVDRCAVYRLEDRPHPLEAQYQWVCDAAEDASLPSPSTGNADWLYERLGRFETVSIGSPDGLPEAATGVEEWMETVGAQSVTVVPMVTDWNLTGALVVAVNGGRDPLSEAETRLVRTMGDVITRTLERHSRVLKLERQNARLEEFANVVSHDLRNPLNVASGFINVAMDEHDADELVRAADAVDRMDDIIDDVLTLARQGRTVGDRSRVNVADVARTAWESVETSNALLVVDDGVGAVTADDSRLSEALENLYRNAVTHGGPDVTVTVGPVVDGFYVADDGPGVPPGDRESVFERGFTTDEAGTGFGLAIVRRVVEAHGWSITLVESGSGGARFEIRTTRRRPAAPSVPSVSDD